MQDGDITIRSEVDAGFLDAAEREIYDILLTQHLAFSERWYSNKLLIKGTSFLRLFGIAACVFGLALCLFVLLVTPAWCPAWFNIRYYIPAFLILGIIFYFLPSIENAIKKWGRAYAPKNCRKIAARCVREARKLVPYTAEYTINGDAITYHRVKDGEIKSSWTRKLKGVAIHGSCATVFFRKWTSFQPIMIILHEDFGPIRTVLINAGIGVRSSGYSL